MGLFQKILVPYDFSRSATAALAAAVDLAAIHGGTLRVLHVLPPLHPIHGPAVAPPAADVAEAKARLAAVVARAVEGRDLRRTRSEVVVGPVAVAILDAASKADSVVMGTIGRTGMSHLLIGSVAERVVRQATVPVLTVRTRRRAR